jgi:hypothetical protein
MACDKKQKEQEHKHAHDGRALSNLLTPPVQALRPCVSSLLTGSGSRILYFELQVLFVAFSLDPLYTLALVRGG